MNSEPGDHRSCLVCQQNVPVSTFPRANSVLDRNLEVFWLLGKVLEVPGEQLARFLEGCPDNLEGWIKICGKCGELVRECQVVYQQLLEVKRRWIECRLKVVGIIKETWEDRGDLEEMEVDIARESRDFVKKYEYKKWRRPWTSGDLRALELAIKLRESTVVKEEPEENLEAFDERGEGILFSPEGIPEDVSDFAEDYDQDWKLEVKPSPDFDLSYTKTGRKRKRKNLPVNTKLPVKCHLCQKSLSSQNTLSNHLEIVHQIKTRIRSKYPFSRYTKKPFQAPLLPGTLFRVKCPVSSCPQTWSALAPYLTHMEKEHTSKEKCEVSSLSKVIECIDCGKMFRTLEQAEDHWLKHDKTLKRDKICEFCGAAFITKRRLLTHKHMKAECRQGQGLKEKESAVCSICGKTYLSRSHLNRHVYSTHGKGQTKNLQKRIANRFHLKSHINQVHPKDKPNFECPKSQKSFNTNLLLKKHPLSNCGTIKTKRLLKPLPDNKFRLKCPVSGCPKTWANPNLEASTYRVHLATEHTPEDKSELPKYPKFLECLECGKTLHDFFNGRIHLYQHDKSLKKKSVDCNVCGVTFATASNLSHHKQRSLKCRQLQGLTENKKTETVREAVICDICGKGYATQNSLQNHIRKTHEGKKQTVCDVCGVSLAPTTNLKEHKKRSLRCRRLQGLTDSEATVICNVCGKAYSNRLTLQKHIREQHEGIFAQTCEYCGKGLESKSKLNIHLANVHGKMDSLQGNGHKCPAEACGKVFGTKRKVTDHFLGVHKQGEPGFKCEQCGKAFYAPAYLSQHVNVVHKGYRWKPKNKKIV